jgi:hypothetical protein
MGVLALPLFVELLGERDAFGQFGAFGAERAVAVDDFSGCAGQEPLASHWWEAREGRCAGNDDWRFAESGERLPLARLDVDERRWRLLTFRERLSSYSRHPIAEMLAPDGSSCGPYTRGVLQRRPVRDGERWLILKEAAVWGDDPRHAFSVPEPEKVRAGRNAASADWKSKIRPALAVVGPAAVAQEMRLAERSARAWLAGVRQAENPAKVARAIVAVAHRAGLGLTTDQHLRTEEICGQLPRRAAVVQFLIVIAVAALAKHYGGVRALARAMAKPGGADVEPTVRRWRDLAQSEPRPIVELNRFVSRLAKFSRAEIKKSRPRIRRGPVGDRQAVLAHTSLLNGAAKPVVPTPEETLALPVLLGWPGSWLVSCGRLPVNRPMMRNPRTKKLMLL